MNDKRRTLLLRLVGPQQSWGTQSRFAHRETGREPSKSGVIGLICAALGRRREESVDDLAALRMGVRVNREGRLSREYQTAQGTVKAGGRGVSDYAILSERFYLAEADFLVGLEGGEADAGLLESIRRAVEKPVWPIYLGRKAFIPSRPLTFPGCLTEAPLEEALRGVPWERPVTMREGDRPRRLRVILEVEYGTPSAEVRQDQPRGAAFDERSFGLRYIHIDLWDDFAIEEVKTCTSPD